MSYELSAMPNMEDECYEINSTDLDENLIQENIKKLNIILDNEGIISSLKSGFSKLSSEPRNFEELEYIINQYENVLNLIDSLIASGLDNQTEQLFPLFNLKSSAEKVAYFKRIGFMKYILKEKNERQIFFNNLLTEEEINKRYRKIASHLHPDKTSGFIISDVSQDEFKNLGTELFIIVSEIRKNLLLELNVSAKKYRLINHEEKANEFWKMAIEFRNAHKAQWDKLKIYNKETLIDIPSDVLMSESINRAGFAYQEYRAACKLADEEGNLKKQLKLRGYMALSLYISNQFLEAQLYALSAINLLYRNSNKISREDFNEAKLIFDKVKGGNPCEKSDHLKTEIKSEIKPINQDALVEYVNFDKELSYYEIKSTNNLIHEDMVKISRELMVKADRSLVCWQTNGEEILQAKRKANTYKILGRSMAVAGIQLGVGAGTSSSVAATVLGITAVASITLGVVGGFSSISLVIFGLYSGHKLWKRSIKLLEEPKIRETLNEMMIKAFKAYDKREYQIFFDVLSKEYKNGSRLLKLESRGQSINQEEIVEALLNHGFRPDGVAYLLNLIGEVLISGKVKIKGMTQEEIKLQGCNVLTGVDCQKLKVEAEKLDNRIKELRRKSMKGIKNKILDFIRIRDHSRIAEENKDDKEEMPFVTRLEEMRNTAKINLSIQDILNGGPEEIERAKEVITEVRKSVENNKQLFHIAATRLEVLEDFLWVISADKSSADSRLAITSH